MEKNKIEWIDGLKGFGCMTVVFLHLLACILPDAQNGAVKYVNAMGGCYNFIQLTPINIFFNGSFFVYIFWMISAYLMVASKKNIFEREIRKFLRLFIIVFVVSIVAFVLFKCGCYYHLKAGNFIENSFWINERDYSKYGLVQFLREILWNDWLGGISYLIPPLWTMKVELIGCVLAGFIILAGQQNNIRVLLLFSGVLIGTGYVIYICFLLGIWLASMNKSTDRNLIKPEILFVGGGDYGRIPTYWCTSRWFI